MKQISKQQYYNNLFNECNNDKLVTWKIINTLISKTNKSSHNGIPQKNLIDGKLYKTNTAEFVDKINDHFTNIGKRMAAKIPHVDTSYTPTINTTLLTSFVMTDIKETEVMDSISSLKTKAAPGLHGISTKFLKISKSLITPILVKFFNKCIEKEIFPVTLKQTQIPIPKINSPTYFSDFRPILLLPTLSKIFEKIIYKQMISYLTKYNILSPCQFVFFN